MRSTYLVCHISPYLPISPPQVRSIYLVWNEKLKLARLPLKYFANGHSFFVQRMYAKPDSPPPFVVHMTYQYPQAG